MIYVCKLCRYITDSWERRVRDRMVHVIGFTLSKHHIPCFLFDYDSWRDVFDTTLSDKFCQRRLLEKFEDTKGVIRSRKLKERQYNGKKNKDKGRKKNDIQNTA